MSAGCLSGKESKKDENTFFDIRIKRKKARA
jgi:hypothetical protein